MNTKLFFTNEGFHADDFYPFSLTQPVEDMPIGILSNRKRWEYLLNLDSLIVDFEPYKINDAAIVQQYTHIANHFIIISANVLPTPELIQLVKQLKHGDVIVYQNQKIVSYISAKNQFPDENKIEITDALIMDSAFSFIHKFNNLCINLDIDILKPEAKALPIQVLSITKNEHIYIDATAQVGFCFLNATDGPIYIGKNAVIMDGAMLRGPLVINDNTVVKMGATIYGGTIIGKSCTVGGEIKNSIIFDNSNKAHDGYLGDAIVGEWCNLGAGTTCSNVKNTAAFIDIELKNRIIKTQKMGVFMGAYSKTAIHTSINTATIIGVAANVFGTGLMPKSIESFSWGVDNSIKYDLDKLFEHIDNWKQFRKMKITDSEKKVLTYLYKTTKSKNNA